MILMITSSSVFAASTVVNSKKYTHPAFFKTSLYRLFHGVDVSVWQGDINWKKSKADGIDFAIIRCGYTALNKFTLHQDSTFVKNYNEAKEAAAKYLDCFGRGNYFLELQDHGIPSRRWSTRHCFR